MTGTLIFLGLCVAFAALLWHDRPARGRENVWRLLRLFLIIGLPWVAFVGAAIMSNGDRLTVRVTQLRVPIAAVSRTGDMRPYLIVGDRAEDADLVVAPYADQSLSRISMPPEARRFVAIEARRADDGRGRGTMQARLRVQSFAAAPDLDLPGMIVMLDGRAIEANGPQLVELQPDRRHSFTIARRDLDGSRADRRSFVLTLVRGRNPAIELNLDSPLVADAGSCGLPRLRLSPMTSADAPEQSFRDPDNLVFGGLGAGGSQPVLERNWLGPLGNVSSFCARSETNFYWPSGVDRNDARLLLESQRIFIPWFCCIFVTLCGLALHPMCGTAWRQPSAERILVPFLQWLMALRLLIAIAGYYNDIDQIPGPVLWDGMSAFLCISVLAMLALRPGDGKTLKTLLAGLALLVVSGFAALLVYLGTRVLVSIPTGMGVLTLAAIAVRMRARSAEAPLSRLVGFVARRLERGPETGLQAETAAGAPAGEEETKPVGKPALTRRIVAGWRAQPPAWRWGIMVVAALVALRVLLIMAGWVVGARFTERVGPIPLSMVYIPGIILGFALLLDGARYMRDRPALVSTLIAFGAAWIFIPFATRDAGAIFVCAWPVGGVIAWFALRRRSERRSVAGLVGWALPVALPILIVALVGLTNYVAGPIPSPAEASASESPQTTEHGAPSLANLGPHIASVSGWDRNDVRMLAFFSPAAVEQLGTKFAFESLDMTTSLRPLTAGVFGRGYLAPSNVRTPLLTNQYFENLPAVHLMWPLGRLGALGLLIVMLVGTAALRVPAVADASGLPDWRAILAILAQVTFVWAALYMILANLNWVPFTGRNVYMLAVTSGGDLPEGLLLLLMLCVPLTRALAARER